jgi:hypothetical protein
MTPEQEQKIQFVNDSGIGPDYVRCPSCDKKRIAEGRTEDLCVPFNSEADMVCSECGDVRLPYDCQGGTFDLEYPEVLPPLRTTEETKPTLEAQKKPESNCRDCVRRTEWRFFEKVNHLTDTRSELKAFFDAIPPGPITCGMVEEDPEITVRDCAKYQQIDPRYILTTATTAKWSYIEVPKDGDLRFVMPPDATAEDEYVCKAWAKAIEECRTIDDSRIVWNACITKTVTPTQPSPIATFPATASYIGGHVLQYVMRDGGRALLQRHASGAGTLFVCVESASPGVLLMMRDMFAGMMCSLMKTERAAFCEFGGACDWEFGRKWKPKISVCILSRTAAPVIYGALHGLPFPREEFVLPSGERVDTKMRKVFTKELADSFPDQVAREIALASLAVYEAQQDKKGS